MSKTVRKIIRINEEKCDGCGLCIPACAEGALQIVDGKAKLIDDRFCDGLGNCLGECPRGAIEIIEREADPFDEKAVEEHLKSEKSREEKEEKTLPCGCPGSMERSDIKKTPGQYAPESDSNVLEPELSHWPVQLQLVSPRARFLQEADLLISADCVPFAYPDFHRKFLRERSLLVGCPKLDGVDYAEKLTEIIRENDIKSVTVVRMEVPCCGGLELAAKKALQQSGKFIPWQVVTVTVDGRLVEE